jgi:hypothetical protein
MPDTVDRTPTQASDEPDAKRLKMEEKKLLRDLPADEFVRSVAFKNEYELKMFTEQRANM